MNVTANQSIIQTQNKVKALQEEVDQVEQKTDKKVLTLKGQFHEHKIKWHAERSLLVQQIELSQRLMTDAEKDADGVLAQLEEFVVEAEQLVRYISLVWTCLV